MATSLYPLPLPCSPPGGWGSPCIKNHARGQRNSPCLQACTTGARTMGLSWVRFLLTVCCRTLSSPQWWLFSFLHRLPIALCQGALVFPFPGLSLQGGCQALKLAAGTTQKPLLGDCSPLAWTFWLGAQPSSDSVGREQRRQEAGWDSTLLSALKCFLSLSPRFHMSRLNVYLVMTFPYGLCRFLGARTRPPTATSSTDQSSCRHLCLSAPDLCHLEILSKLFALLH